MTPSRKLTLDDIADMRAYERERADFRARVIELKRRRRVSVGPYVTLVFENRDTIRFQIQEMARVERLYYDAQIETELQIYNPLVPEPGHLSATMFIELTSDAQLREWLPKLVGIEKSVRLRIGDRTIAFAPDVDHEQQLTREELTSSVHYVHASLSAAEVAAFVGDARLAIDHPAYRYEAPLTSDTKAELLSDLLPDAN
jgi:hypothetical protein